MRMKNGHFAKNSGRSNWFERHHLQSDFKGPSTTLLQGHGLSSQERPSPGPVMAMSDGVPFAFEGIEGCRFIPKRVGLHQKQYQQEQQQQPPLRLKSESEWPSLALHSTDWVVVNESTDALSLCGSAALTYSEAVKKPPAVSFGKYAENDSALSWMIVDKMEPSSDLDVEEEEFDLSNENNSFFD